MTTIENSLLTQTRELTGLWEEMMRLQPRLRPTIPINLELARRRFGELQSVENKGFGDNQMHLLFRVGLMLRGNEAPMTMGELSEALNVPMSTATRTIDWLVESGYVERLHDPEDRRVVRVMLSEAGKELYATFNEYLSMKLEEFLGHFTPDERTTLLVLAGRVVQVLAELCNAPKSGDFR